MIVPPRRRLTRPRPGKARGRLYFGRAKVKSVVRCWCLVSGRPQVGSLMCRNIRTLHNFKPPATAEEIRASSLQFVRKLSGFNRPSKANEIAFARAVDRVAHAAHELLDSLVTNAPPRDREIEAVKARAKAANRFRPSDAREAAR